MANNNTLMISVIIPSYRPTKYTHECLEALKKQTLAQEVFEVIVVLNGERGPYEEFLKQAMPSNGRLFYSPVASACSSRNMGLDNARGEYICFIDDDDPVSPTYLEELLKEASPEVISISYSLSLFEDGHTERNQFSKEYERCVGRGEQPFFRPKKMFSGPCMKMIHKDIIGNRRFDNRFPSGQDALLMFEISDRMDKVRFTTTNAIYYYRQRGGSLHQMSDLKRISKYSRLAWAYTKLYFRHPRKYHFYFYITRILASCHAILARK